MTTDEDSIGHPKQAGLFGLFGQEKCPKYCTARWEMYGTMIS